MEPGFIGIVGGMGRMGRLLKELLEEKGLGVKTFDLLNGPIDWPAAGACRVLFLTVPLSAMERTCAALGPHTRPDGAIIDIGSVKEEPLGLMMEHCQGEVIGGHPLFGPQTQDFKGHTFFLCPGRPGPVLPWFKNLLRQSGLHVVEMEAPEHDRLMAVVQLLRHMLIFSFGLTLERQGFRPDSRKDSFGPWFGALVEMLDRQAALGPDLFADLAAHNPHTARIADDLMDSARQVARAYATRDQGHLVDFISGIIPPTIRAEASRGT